jgi:RNA polymerase sigma-70 factor (ECF subfamily)
MVTEGNHTESRDGGNHKPDRSLGSHADAEDLTLEVFVRLHRAAGDYRPTARFTTYLFQKLQAMSPEERLTCRRKLTEEYLRDKAAKR